MVSQAIIYLSNSSLKIVRWEGKQLQEVLSLQNAETASEPLAFYFKENREQPIRIVVDILEEMYSLESLPHLNSRDRQAMIKRKQQQLYPKFKLVHSEFKKRSILDRRDDLTLFTAITDEQLLHQWIQILFELKVNIAVIYSLPILMESFVQQLQGKNNKFIISLFSNDENVILRQSFFMDDLLVISRYKQLQGIDDEMQAKEIEEDVNRSLRFATRQFNTLNKEKLSTYFFGSGLETKNLFNKINFSAIGMQPKFFLTNDFARVQGNQISGSCGFPVYIAGLNARKKRSKTHYQDSQSEFFHNHFLFKKRLRLARTLIIVCGLIYSVFSFIDNSDQASHLTNLKTEKIQLLNKLENAPDSPIYKGYTPFEMESQLQTHEKIEKQILSSEQIMTEISLVLDDYPEISLTKLEWGGEKEENSMADVAYLDPTLYDPTSSGMVETDTIETILLTIQAEIKPFNGNYRYALSLIEHFSKRLEDSASIQKVNASKLPVDISKENELSGAMKSQRKKAGFILDMQWIR